MADRPPEYEDIVHEGDDHLDPDGKEILESDSDVDSIDLTESKSSKSYLIDQKGLSTRSLPRLPADLETHIKTFDDGLAAYVSKREKRSSGNCVLSHVKGGDLISTQYRFGPGRPPEVEYCQAPSGSSPIVITSKFGTRASSFVAPNGKTFTWQYAKEKATKSNLLVLTEGTGESPSTALATLIRNEQTRTAGTKKSAAGNGGKLVIISQAAELIDESLIVATVLVMLKKEIDRRISTIYGGFMGAAASA